MDPRLRIAFLTLYPVETASTRQRIHKNVRFFPPDVESRIYPGITQASLARLEERGHGPIARLVFLLEEVGRKLVHLWQARRAHVIVVQKGLTVMNVRGLPFLLRALGRPIVFDFDDAVYLEPPQSFRAKALRVLTDPGQVTKLIARADAVVAGNRFLATFAEAARAGAPEGLGAYAGTKAPAAQVTVIVTPMDTDWYTTRRDGVRRSGTVVIGWSGSTTTNHYVDLLAPVLRAVTARHPEVEFRVISNDDRAIHWDLFAGVRTSFVPWRLDSLVADLTAFDVGVMPLREDEWSRSKCGGKILQYMACGIPTVASPVGINAEVIEDGVNGLLAGEDAEWVKCLSTLVADPRLRERMGEAARRKVEAEHSNHVTAPELLAVVRSVARPCDREA